MHRHGFLVFVPGMVGSQGEIPYLEVVLKDGRSAYAPLALGRTTLRSALRRLVAGLDPAIASETDIIDRQFLPLLSGVEAARPSIEKTIDIGTVSETATRTIVVGLDDAIEKARTLLPVLALDPFLRGTAVVLSARSSDLAGQLQEIKRLAAFYNLPVRAVAGANVEDKLDAPPDRPGSSAIGNRDLPEFECDTACARMARTARFKIREPGKPAAWLHRQFFTKMTRSVGRGPGSTRMPVTLSSSSIMSDIRAGH